MKYVILMSALVFAGTAHAQELAVYQMNCGIIAISQVDPPVLRSDIQIEIFAFLSGYAGANRLGPDQISEEIDLICNADPTLTVFEAVLSHLDAKK